MMRKKLSKPSMPQLEFKKQFLKDMKKWRRSGKNMEPFNEFVRTIRHTWPPPPKYEPHLLSGRLEGMWDIRLQQNWVLFLRFHDGTVYFHRMGTHAELGLS